MKIPDGVIMTTLAYDEAVTFPMPEPVRSNEPPSEERAAREAALVEVLSEVQDALAQALCKRDLLGTAGFALFVVDEVRTSPAAAAVCIHLPGDAAEPHRATLTELLASELGRTGYAAPACTPEEAEQFEPRCVPIRGEPAT